MASVAGGLAGELRIGGTGPWGLDVVTDMIAKTGLSDPELLRDLNELGFTPETVTLLPLVPIVQVAWAEGGVSDLTVGWPTEGRPVLDRFVERFVT